VGASLLAKAVDQSTSMLNVPQLREQARSHRFLWILEKSIFVDLFFDFSS
jgi:hypothetical protein